MKNKATEQKLLLEGYIARHAALASVLSIAKHRRMVGQVAAKLIEMMDLPGKFYTDNARQTVEWWLDFALQYEHSDHYSEIRLKYYEGDVSKLDMPRHTRVGGGA